MAQCVLAIDDSPEVLALIGVRLRPEGLRFMTATSGEEGIALTIRTKPDLVLLDVDMPDQSGLDVCRRLKADPTTSGIPIIFLTATEDVTTKVHCFDLGAVDYVTKPFHPAELRARVRSALRMKRAQDMLGREAQVDVVTGLRTRGYFEERLPTEVAIALGERRSLSLLRIEVDHFRALIDTFGYPFGDLVLQRVAEVIGKTLTPTAEACLLASDDLAIVLPRTSLPEAEGVAKAIHEAVRSLELSPRGRKVVVTVSVGVAEALSLASDSGSIDAPMLLAAAELGLALAKREGRDRVRASHGRPSNDDVHHVANPGVETDSRSGRVLLDRYVLDRKIGEGGMGAVYRAMHLTLGELVAVKFLHDVWKWSNEHRARFRREASILSRLRHPGIVSILDFGELDKELFMVMELVKGHPLSRVIRSEAGLSHARIGTIFGEILGVLALAHAENVVHRDIKPENVMLLDSAEGADRIKVLDFGIAYLADAPEGVGRLTGTGEFRGTAHYMAPEQWSNREVGPGADVYAVGVMLYEALSGRLPFDGDGLPAIIMQHVLAEPPPLLDRTTNLPLSPALDALVKRALAKTAADRPSARELASQLSQLLSSEEGLPIAEAREVVVPPVSGSRLIAAPRFRDQAGNE